MTNQTIITLTLVISIFRFLAQASLIIVVLAPESTSAFTNEPLIKTSIYNIDCGGFRRSGFFCRSVYLFQNYSAGNIAYVTVT